MRRRIGLFHHSLVLLVLFSVLTLGLLVSTPKEASAFADLKEGNCAQCHDDGRKPEGTGGTTTPAPATPAPATPAPATPAPATPAPATPAPATPAPTTPAPATPAPTTPAQPTESQSSNPLLIGGLFVGVLVIGGAIWMDKRKKMRIRNRLLNENKK